MSTNRQGPGIEAGAIAPQSGLRTKRYSFKQTAALADGTLVIGRVELPAGAEGLITGAGFSHHVVAGATGDIDYAFQKVIAAGNGRHATAEGAVIPIQRALARASLINAAADTPHVVQAGQVAGTATDGAAGTIDLAVADRGIDDDEYEGCMIRLTGGPGAGDVRQITSYVAATGEATVNANFSAVPTTATTYVIDPQLAHRREGMRLGIMHQSAAVAGPTSTTMDLDPVYAVPVTNYYANSIVTKFTSPIERRIIVSSAIANERITVDPAWTNDPVAGDVYRIDHDNLIVHDGDLLLCELSGAGAAPPTETDFWVDVQELSAYSNNN